jgi:hypothetical protein
MNTMISDLQELEKVIDAKRGTESFYEIGKALEKIRDAKLYKEDHKNFNFYCRERWDMAQRTAYQFISASSVIDHLCDFKLLPINEAQARPLTRLLPDQLVEVWQIVLDQDQPITAKLITQIVAEYIGIDDQPKPKPEPKETAEHIRDRIDKAVISLKALTDAIHDLDGADKKILFNQTDFSRKLLDLFYTLFDDMGIGVEETPEDHRDCWEVLGIDKEATAEQAKMARDKMAKMYHPDKFIDPEFKKLGEIRTKQINGAYDEFCAFAHREESAVAPVKKTGRPKGTGKSKLDEFQAEIEAMLGNGSTQKSIAKRYNTSQPNLFNWMKRRGIKKDAQLNTGGD